ncbi:MAG: rhodanese-like domain-containing protein [Bacteroidia bacterium]|nr:rhodanese-like domain-containing protein [Bacteroidia bacterium]
MKRVLVLLALGLITSVACGQSAQPATVAQAKTYIGKGAQVLDVRTPTEVAAGKVKGATVANVNAPDFDAALSLLDKQKPVVVYCAAGVRARRAADRLVAQGFTQVYYLAGAGFEALKTAGIATE